VHASLTSDSMSIVHRFIEMTDGSQVVNKGDQLEIGKLSLFAF
jgi:hypothetical protein